MVNEFQILSILNGQLAVSRMGPKSAVDPKNSLTKRKALDKNYELFDVGSFLQARDMNLAKSKRAGVYLKHMVSEILLLLACNRDAVGLEASGVI